MWQKSEDKTVVMTGMFIEMQRRFSDYGDIRTAESRRRLDNKLPTLVRAKLATERSLSCRHSCISSEKVSHSPILRHFRKSMKIHRNRMRNWAH